MNCRGFVFNQKDFNPFCYSMLDNLASYLIRLMLNNNRKECGFKNEHLIHNQSCLGLKKQSSYDTLSDKAQLQSGLWPSESQKVYELTQQGMNSMPEESQEKSFRPDINDITKGRKQNKEGLLRFIGGFLPWLPGSYSNQEQSDDKANEDLKEEWRVKQQELKELAIEMDKLQKKREDNAKMLEDIRKRQQEEIDKRFKAEEAFEKHKEANLNEYKKELLKSLQEEKEQYLHDSFTEQTLKEMEQMLHEIFKAEEFTQKSQSLIEETAKKKSFASMSHFNIVLEGKTGVGKSTLINEFLQLNADSRMKTKGFGKPTTLQMVKCESNSMPLRLWDDRGIDLRSYGIDQAMKHIGELVNVQAKENDPDQLIHAIWYCISTPGHRFEDFEVKSLKDMIHLYEGGKLPVFVVLTQSYDSEEAKRFKANLREVLPESIEIIPVVAEEKYNIKPYGFNELLSVTTSKVTQSTSSACHHSIVLQIKEELKLLEEELMKKAQLSIKQILPKAIEGQYNGECFCKTLRGFLSHALQLITFTFVSLNNPKNSLSKDSLKLIDAFIDAFTTLTQEKLKSFPQVLKDHTEQELFSKYLIMHRTIEQETGCSLPFDEFEDKWLEVALKEVDNAIEENSEVNAIQGVVQYATSAYLKITSIIFQEELDKATISATGIIKEKAEHEAKAVTERILGKTDQLKAI